MQTNLPLENLRKEDIKRLAHFLIKEQYGTIPSLGEPTLKKDIWKIPINANYPRLLFNNIEQKPDRIRFMSFKNLGAIEMSKNGKIISKPKYYEIVGFIEKKLKEVRESVEKALIKVAADKFSLLTFPDHMFTPIQDLLAWLLMRDNVNIKKFLEFMPFEKQEKYKQHINLLESVKLIRLEGDLILPANDLIEIEMNKELSRSKKLAAALTLFYKRGYEHLSTISSFLGPHLIISGYAYTTSIENNEIIAIRENEFENLIMECYPHDKSKLTKLPRYLFQLESIGMLIPSNKEGEIDSWKPNPSVFESLIDEEEIITPIHEMMI